MNDEDFARLEPPQATAALAQIANPEERRRLSHLYARTRGMLVDGTGASPRPFDPARLAAAQAAIAADAAVARKQAAYDSVPGSGMLTGGRLLFLVGLAVGVIAFIYLRRPTQTLDDLAADGYALVVLYASASAVGFGAFMWMLGAIEQRLLEIREVMRNPV
ncbi:MAG TPA: hypothetical protein VKQ70_00740 [Caulobacteraceae bacterium]|jgi:hypothetical protein|nr:hypothetical protein [Caulobacteraceae bacterium]